MEICAATKICAENLLKEGVVAVSLVKEWPSESPHKEEVALLQGSRNMQLAGMMMEKSDQGRSWRTSGRS